jgi:hypothetical protein
MNAKEQLIEAKIQKSYQKIVKKCEALKKCKSKSKKLSDLDKEVHKNWINFVHLSYTLYKEDQQKQKLYVTCEQLYKDAMRHAEKVDPSLTYENQLAAAKHVSVYY